MDNQPQFVLASASPARRQLLLNAGIVPIVQPSHFDESAIRETDPVRLVEILAQGKAQVVADQYTAAMIDTGSGGKTQVVIVGCDSILVMAGQVYGKPSDEADAIARWQTMRGQTATLLTGHAIIGLTPSAPPHCLVRHRATMVEFAQVSDRQIAAYVATGEPMQCAGCFTLEGRGSAFIESITGCHSNVLGLSMPLLRQMLGSMGYDITDFWHL